MRTSLSSNQIPAIKRAIQLIRKAAKQKSAITGEPSPIDCLSLNDVQNAVSKAFHFGSFKELVLDAEKHPEPLRLDYQNIEDNTWLSIRENIMDELKVFEDDDSVSLAVRSTINLCCWFPAPERDLGYLKGIADALVELNDMFSIGEVCEKTLSITINLSSNDHRWMYASAQSVGFEEVSDLCYQKDDVVLFNSGIDNSGDKPAHKFTLELNDNFHNRQLLPQFAVSDARETLRDKFRPAVAIIRGEFSYHYSILGVYLSNDEEEFVEKVKSLGMSQEIMDASLRYSLFGKDNDNYRWFTSKA